MNDLKTHFLHRSITGLQDLTVKLENGDGQLPPDVLRILHTIKGTAQTFGLAAAANLAHKLEDVVASGNRALLLEGIPLLIGALEEKEIAQSDFSKRAGAAVAGKATRRKTFISGIPLETFNQFSDIEKQRIMSIDGDGGDIFCLQLGFDLATFTEDFKNIREKIESIGEIIATLPGAGGAGQIGFRIYATAANYGEVNAVCVEYSGRLERQSVPWCHLYEALAGIGEHAEILAGKSGKDITVLIYFGDIPSDIDTTKTIFDILLHLVRNAVDHAFIERGTISIGLKEIAKGGLSITVSDDGRGLDPDDLKRKAIEKGLIDAGFTGEPMDLIFLPGFSTAETLSETSGRGAGLDAVKDIVESKGGTITVTSEKDTGTAFAILLP